MSLNFLKDQTTSVSIILTSTGAPATGVSFGDVTATSSKNGASPQVFTLSNTNFVEISSISMPGLYHITLPSTILDTSGELIVHFSGVAFDSYLIRGIVYETLFDQLGTQLTTVTSQSALNTTAIATVQTASLATNTSVDALDLKVTSIATGIDQVKGVGFASTDSLADLRSVLDSRIPSEVASKDLFVNGTGTATPPLNTGIWDTLGSLDTSIADLSLDIQRLLGLSQENYKISDQTYDANDNLISGVIRLFGSSSDLNANLNPIATYVISASYDASNRLVTYQVAKQ